MSSFARDVSYAEEAEEPEDVSTLSCRARCFYYCVGFCAHWFGPKAFDADGDGKFDINDVRILLAEKPTDAKTFAKDADGEGAGGEKDELLQTDSARERRKSLVEDLIVDNDLLDGFEAEVEGIRYAEGMTEFPYFILGQSLFALCIWFAGMIYNCAISDDSDTLCASGWTSNLAGFITLPAPVGPNSVLAYHSMDCTSYRTQVWRLLTYQWTHTGLAHVSMNVLLNIVLGVPLGAFNGWFRMMCMYNGGIIGGAFVVGLVDVHSTVVGMSGGCYALMGEKIADLAVNWYEKAFRWAELAFLFAIIGADCFFTLFVNAANEPKSSIACHAGGLYCGVVLGLVFARNLLETPGEIICRRFFVALTVVGAASLFIWKYFYVHFPPKNFFSTQPGWCSIQQVSDVQYFNDTDYHCIFCDDDPACWQQWSARASAFLYNVTYATCKSLEWENGNTWNTFGPPLLST